MTTTHIVTVYFDEHISPLIVPLEEHEVDVTLANIAKLSGDEDGLLHMHAENSILVVRADAVQSVRMVPMTEDHQCLLSPLSNEPMITISHGGAREDLGTNEHHLESLVELYEELRSGGSKLIGFELSGDNVLFIKPERLDWFKAPLQALNEALNGYSFTADKEAASYRSDYDDSLGEPETTQKPTIH